MVKVSKYLVIAFFPFAAVGPAIALDADPKGQIPGRTAGQETSDRTPGKETTTPLSQVTKTEGRETSVRTPRLQDDAGQAQGQHGSTSSTGASEGASGSTSSQP